MWRARDDGVYYPIPLVHITPEHIIRLKTCGTLLLLHFLLFGAAPSEVCPMTSTLLLQMALLLDGETLGPQHLSWSLPFLGRFDEAIARTITPWSVMKFDGKAPTDMRSVVSVLSQCGLAVSKYSYLSKTTRLTLQSQPAQLKAANPLIPEEWSREDHERWTSTIMSRLLFEQVVWDSREFQFLWDGFNIDFAEKTEPVERSIRTVRFYPTDHDIQLTYELSW